MAKMICPFISGPVIDGGSQRWIGEERDETRIEYRQVTLLADCEGSRCPVWIPIEDSPQRGYCGMSNGIGTRILDDPAEASGDG